MTGVAGAVVRAGECDQAVAQGVAVDRLVQVAGDAEAIVLVGLLDDNDRDHGEGECSERPGDERTAAGRGRGGHGVGH